MEIKIDLNTKGEEALLDVPFNFNYFIKHSTQKSPRIRLILMVSRRKLFVGQAFPTLCRRL